MTIKIYGLLVLLLPVLAFGQDLSGKWSGSLTQGRPYLMEITVSQFGKVLNGASRFTGDDGDFVEMRFTGIIDGTTVTMNENEVSIIPSGLSCALKKLTGHFRVDSATREMVIEGNWTSNRVYENKQYHNVPVSSSGAFRVVMGINLQLAKKAKKAIRPLDGYFKKENIPNAKIAPLAVLREADVVFSRRIWREIDLREKNNQYMAAPKGRLIDALMDAVSAGALTAYDPIPSKDDPNGDQFGTPLTTEKAKLKLADSAVMNIIDKKTGDKTGSKMVAGEFNPDSVVKFRIKEDEFFDKQRSVYEYRIIGIAPVIRHKIEGVATAFDYQPAFWLYFPAARKMLAKKEIVNNRNDAADLSFDDAFSKRLFTSYIIKESNDRDERIRDHARGADRLTESGQIRKTLMDWELNLWQY